MAAFQGIWEPDEHLLSPSCRVKDLCCHLRRRPPSPCLKIPVDGVQKVRVAPVPLPSGGGLTGCSGRSSPSAELCTSVPATLASPARP